MTLMNSLLLMSFMMILMVKSPFSMCLSLVSFVISLGFMMHLMGLIWLMYTLIIMFLGGMMIVFVYTSSVNNSFKLKVKMNLPIFLSVTMFMFSLMSFLNIGGMLNKPQEAVWNFLYGPSSGLIIFLGAVIIMSLFIVVKLVQVEKGPLKI